MRNNHLLCFSFFRSVRIKITALKMNVSPKVSIFLVVPDLALREVRDNFVLCLVDCDEESRPEM